LFVKLVRTKIESKSQPNSNEIKKAVGCL